MSQYEYTGLLVKAATYNYPEEIPVSVWVLPAAFHRHGEAVHKIMDKYPGLGFSQDRSYNPYKDVPASYHKGTFLDPWGCLWSNMEEGMEAIVTGHPVPERKLVHTMRVPEVDAGLPHGFMYLRLLDLRGFEETMIDFAEEPPELKILIDKVLAYNLTQMEKLVKNSSSRMMWFGDDLGMQNGLAIGAEKWRKYMKPCYTALYKPCLDAGKLVYMHTDGCIHEIIPDLADCGVAIVNPQFRANGLDNLLRVCKGKIPINLDLDRQLFPFASKGELRDHVMECVESFYLPEGGFGLNLEIGFDVPLESMDVLFDAVDKARTFGK